MILSSTKNDFDAKIEYLEYTQLVPLHDAISFVCSNTSMMSKRLSQPMTFHNSRIYNDEGMFLFQGDIHLPSSRRGLSKIAEFYGQTLYLLHEHGNKVIWTSTRPYDFLGYCKVYGKVPEEDEPVTIAQALPFYELHAKKQQRQWSLDHGLARRNPIEYMQDVLWNFRWKFAALQRKINKLCK